MGPAAKKQVDQVRLNADLASAKLELLSAQCAMDRIRVQYLPQDLIASGDRQTLKRLIASAEAMHHFFSQIADHLNREETPVAEDQNKNE
ncbi:MAG TPA: hypothetical protein VMX38_21770 [Verrucomicrobiae bacterium]|jgi:hypothetical protein|nr:hypothetical protein [Verrucomicrobiae bacterium]